MFRKTSILSCAATLAALVTMASCGGNKDADVLKHQAQRVDAELAAEAAASPQLFAEADAEYGDSAFCVNVVFADSALHVSDYSQELVEYFISDEIKSRAGKDLDELVNTLAKTKEPLRLTLTDVYGTTRSYDMPAVTLRPPLAAASAGSAHAGARHLCRPCIPFCRRSGCAESRLCP